MKEKMIHLALTKTEVEAIRRCLVLFGTIQVHMDNNFSNLLGRNSTDAFVDLSGKFKTEEKPTPRSKDESILDFYEQDMRGPGNDN